MKASRERLTLGVIPAALLALLVLPFLLFWADLPNPMATHWDFGGTPNGSMPPALLLLLMVGLAAATWLAVVRAVGKVPSEAPSFVAGLFGIVTLLLGVTWLSVLANRGVADWRAADGVGLIQIVLAVVPALLMGYLGWALSGGSGVERTPAATSIPALEVPEPEAAIWSSRGNGPILQVIGVIGIVIAVVVWSWASVLLLLIALAVLIFAEVRVVVSQLGVVISLGWLGVLSRTVPMETITQAEVETVEPMSYGGWGYRLRPGVRAIVTRRGEALRLVRPDKADLVITVDDAATGAGLINSLRGVRK